MFLPHQLADHAAVLAVQAITIHRTMGKRHRDMLEEALERVTAGERGQAGHGPVLAGEYCQAGRGLVLPRERG
jgi:hypothetical protein